MIQLKRCGALLDRLLRFAARVIGGSGSVAFALLALPAFAAWPLLAQAGTGSPESALGSLITYGGAVATSLLLGAVKKTDSDITNAPLFRKLQPFITLAGAVFVPWAAQRFGVAVDPSAFTAAPLATVLTIGAGELLSLLKKKT